MQVRAHRLLQNCREDEVGIKDTHKSFYEKTRKELHCKMSLEPEKRWFFKLPSVRCSPERFILCFFSHGLCFQAAKQGNQSAALACWRWLIAG